MVCSWTMSTFLMILSVTKYSKSFLDIYLIYICQVVCLFESSERPGRWSHRPAALRRRPPGPWGGFGPVQGRIRGHQGRPTKSQNGQMRVKEASDRNFHKTKVVGHPQISRIGWPQIWPRRSPEAAIRIFVEARKQPGAAYCHCRWWAVSWSGSRP